MTSLALLAMCGAGFLSTSGAGAADGVAKPHQLIVNLRSRMYQVGETSGQFADLVAAERKAAADMRRWVEGSRRFLVEKNDGGQSPLIAAASYGYAGIVDELLKAENVRQGIDEVDARGLAAWDHANLALRQSAWVCNPAVIENPFVWVPLMVTLPYYLGPDGSPYLRIRRALVGAGAKPDRNRPKRFWQGTCTGQAESTRARVEASDDLLETVIAEGRDALVRLEAQLRSPSRESERPR